MSEKREGEKAGEPGSRLYCFEVGKMGDFEIVVLVIFIIIRLLIAAGLLYLVICEVRRYRKSRAREHKEIDKDADGKDVGGSSGSRD